jgi:hypothetical protein
MNAHVSTKSWELHIGKKDRPAVDPFSIQDAEVLIAAIHHDWGEAQGNYDEFRFFTLWSGVHKNQYVAAQFMCSTAPDARDFQVRRGFCST